MFLGGQRRAALNLWDRKKIPLKAVPRVGDSEVLFGEVQGV